MSTPNNPKQNNSSYKNKSGDTQKVSSDLLQKLPPQNYEAEQAVLGGVFLRNDIFDDLIDIISPEDFYFPVHKIIFSIFLDLYRESKPIDELIVTEKLEATGNLEIIGGAAYLGTLASSMLSASNARDYAEIVREKSIRRSLIKSASEILSMAYELGKPIGEILGEAEQSIFSIAEGSDKAKFRTSRTLVDTTFKNLETRVNTGQIITGLATGYHNFDLKLSGLQPTDVIIVAGRPSMGKTAFALNIAVRVATIGKPKTVAIFSLEMSGEQLIERMLSLRAHVELHKLKNGKLDDSDWEKLTSAAGVLSPANIYVDDDAGLTSLELRARCRRLKAQKGLDLVIVDYLQLMHSNRHFDSREREIAEISRALKGLAKELNIPVIALSQLNRSTDNRSDKRPMLSDLRESGAIEQDADLVIFPFREAAYMKPEEAKNHPNKNKAEIIIGKNRNGATGTIDLAYLGQFTSFEELSEIDDF